MHYSRTVQGHTLVLNADAQPLNYLPISVLHWQDAVREVFLDKVDVVAEYEDWEVRSPSTTIKVPAIVMVRSFIKPKKVMNYSRFNVYLRDSFTCQFCLERVPINKLTLDHVIPRSFGGKTKFDNIVASCETCNVRKGNRQTMKPIRMPFKPSYYQLVNERKNLPISVPHESWVTYLGWSDESLIEVKERQPIHVSRDASKYLTLNNAHVNSQVEQQNQF